MAKHACDEVEILRFFENESIDRATVLFNIVSDKMRTRLSGQDLASAIEPTRARKARVRTSDGKPETISDVTSESR